MKEENKKIVDKKKIIIPIVILIIIAGIWFSQNTGDTQAIITDSTTVDSADNFALLVTEQIDLEQLKSYGVPIIIDFGADDCIPCKEMAPVLATLNLELQGKAIIKFVDVWTYPEIAENYPIRVIPTQLFIDKDGNPYNPSTSIDFDVLMYGSEDSNDHLLTAHEGGLTEEMMRIILEDMGVTYD